MRVSRRAESIEPFHVMQVAKEAHALAATLGPGQPRMIFLNIGEPDFTAPPLVQAAAAQAVADGRTQYTAAMGIAPLRERLSAWYQSRFGVAVSPERIMITAGASAGLQLACMLTCDEGDEILMPDPSYPCNRHILTAIGARAVLLPTTAASRYQLNAAQMAKTWGPRTRGVLLASPSNPTGTSVEPAELQRILALVAERGGAALMDEIYLGLSHDERYAQTALAYSEDVISINSFSKYFNMTGWRLGWLVLPPALVPAAERLQQNLFICASTVAQQAALACFEPDSLAEYERRRAAFKARRDAFIPALRELGLGIPVMPDGAFYAWADASPWFERLGVSNSTELVQLLLRRAYVVVTPSTDFHQQDQGTHIRFSTASSMEDLQEAAQRLKALLG
ncbi:MAG: pyridoxal phosphate-dependent aminotransferase [Serpentinimonas sp.]|nr:pyridoxal phosphate-dependent aminotransferase [Serpentinimonas sp.]